MRYRCMHMARLSFRETLCPVLQLPLECDFSTNVNMCAHSYTFVACTHTYMCCRLTVCQHAWCLFDSEHAH